MNSRDVILGRIREALAGSPAVEEPPAVEVWPECNPDRQTLLTRFAERLAAVQGETHHCGSMDEARRKLAELIAEAGWETMGAVDRPLSRDLVAGLDADRVAWATDGWEPREMAELSAGLVEAEFLLADTGSALVSSDTPQQRLLCYLPPVCIVVARTEQLVEHMPAAWPEVARRAAEPERRGEFVIITGPSRTADIEKILILGVHGPKRLIVLTIDE